MTKVYVFNNLLVTDVKPLVQIPHFEGAEVVTRDEDGYGILSGVFVGEDGVQLKSTSPTAQHISRYVEAGDVVVMTHPSHIVDDNNRHTWFMDVLTAGAKVFCLTTGDSFEAVTRSEASEEYTRWMVGANEIATSKFKLF